MMNESPSSFFKASRGLRQEHLLFYLPFIGVLEALNKLLLRARGLDLFREPKVGGEKERR